MIKLFDSYLNEVKTISNEYVKLLGLANLRKPVEPFVDKLEEYYLKQRLIESRTDKMISLNDDLLKKSDVFAYNVLKEILHEKWNDHTIWHSAFDIKVRLEFFFGKDISNAPKMMTKDLPEGLPMFGYGLYINEIPHYGYLSNLVVPAVTTLN